MGGDDVGLPTASVLARVSPSHVAALAQQPIVLFCVFPLGLLRRPHHKGTTSNAREAEAGKKGSDDQKNGETQISTHVESPPGLRSPITLNRWPRVPSPSLCVAAVAHAVRRAALRGRAKEVVERNRSTHAQAQGKEGPCGGASLRQLAGWTHVVQGL